MKKKTANILITTSAGVLGVGVAAVISLFLIVPLMKNTCTLFDRRCMSVSYQKLPNGQLLVKDPVLGLSYWYDGNFIRSYGVKLQGTCPSSVPIDADTVDVAAGDTRPLCLRFDPDGNCVDQSDTDTVPTQLQGTPQPSQTGLTVMEPTFVMNAHTLATSQDGVLCSRARNVIEDSFVDVPTKTVKTFIPRGDDWALDASQLFSILKTKGVFSPPLEDPEPPVCNGHGKVDPLTAACVCDTGYTGTLCGTKLCESDAACGNGSCSAGLCVCDAGWTGDSCDQLTCSSCVNGTCDPNTGTCVCRVGFEGDSCDQRTCAQACVTGTCDGSNGVCVCEPGWTGVACEIKTCPLNCSNNGHCLGSGECVCDEGWRGDGCEESVCLDNCNMNGTCNLTTETCECDEGWTGLACESSACARGCCAHGVCETGTCVCIPGWGGDDCSVPDDPLTTADSCPSEWPL